MPIQVHSQIALFRKAFPLTSRGSGAPNINTNTNTNNNVSATAAASPPLPSPLQTGPALTLQHNKSYWQYLYTGNWQKGMMGAILGWMEYLAGRKNASGKTLGAPGNAPPRTLPAHRSLTPAPAPHRHHYHHHHHHHHHHR